MSTPKPEHTNASSSSSASYRVDSVVGSGNYGQVVLVRHRDTGGVYCMKKVDWKNKTEKQQRDSRNEVKVMSGLHHPNIIDFVEGFVEEQQLHIVMEYADAMDLEKYLVDKIRKKSVVAEGTVMRIFLQITLGLRELHKKHLMHRDLKSANVFLTRSGGVKIGDFGFSKQLNYTMALASTVCGTPYYFAPELCQRTPYNNKVDIWSLGVVLYEMVNLRKPFEARNLPELRTRVVKEPPAPFTATHVSPELKELCFALLNKSSKARPSAETILRMRYVKQYLVAYRESLINRLEKVTKRIGEIADQYARRKGDPGGHARFDDSVASPQSDLESVTSGNAGGTKLKFDRTELEKAAQGDRDAKLASTASSSTTSDPKKPEVHMLHFRPQPDIKALVSSSCPSSIVAELFCLLVEEASCKAARLDVEEVLNTPDPDEGKSGGGKPEGVEEMIGEAETDEEKALREELGDDTFVRAVELALKMSELKTPDSPEAEATLQAMRTLLGKKEYLLSTLQRVAMQFELD